MDNIQKADHYINIHSPRTFKSDVGLATVRLGTTLLIRVWTSPIKVSAQHFSHLNCQSVALIVSKTERTTLCVAALGMED
jgi:hypothetical protein